MQQKQVINFDYCSEGIIRKLEVFLEIFNLHMVFNSNTSGYVLNHNDKMMGVVNLMPGKSIKSNFSCLNGNVTASAHSSGLCVNFSIEKDGTLAQRGFIRSNQDGKVDGQYLFHFDGLELSMFQNDKEISNIRLCSDSSCFYYFNYLTGQKIAFFPLSLTSAGRQFIAERRTNKESHHICMEISDKSSNINQIYIYDRYQGELIPGLNILSRINFKESIWNQMTTAINMSYPEFYQVVDQIVDSYSNDGINLVKEGINTFGYSQMGQEALECCFGKELIKKISVENALSKN